MGLAPRGDASACRWVAVRHADDHIHLAVTLARQDGRRARTSHDYARLGAACRIAEERYGLAMTPARDRTAPKRPTRAETEKALRQSLPETPRQQLRREVRRATLTSTDLNTFVEHLQAAGVEVRLRFSELDPGLVTGYSVANPKDQTAAGDLVWFGGGKLAPQLSLPRLQAVWEGNNGLRNKLGPVAHKPRGLASRGKLVRLASAARLMEDAAAASFGRVAAPPRRI